MIALVLATLLALAPPDSTEAPCPGGKVVTQSDLEAAGVIHLHDVLRLTDVLDAVSVDGFDAAPFGAVGLPQPVRVLLDGAPVAQGAGPESIGLEALPVAVGEVHRVVVCPGPGVAAGAFGGPWLDVQTARPARRAYGAFGVGNESGDPGPLRYLEPIQNVDRWGPDVEAGAAVGPLYGLYRHRDFMPTDAAIADRTFGASVPERYPKRIGWVAAAVAEGARLRARAAARHMSDLPFVPEAAREVPMVHTAGQATVTGDRAWGGVRLGGHGHAARLRLDRADWSALPLDPDWTETRLDAGLVAEAGRISGGLRAEHVAAAGPGLADGTVTLGRAWAQVSGSRVGATLAASGAGSGVGGGGAVAAEWRPAPRFALVLTASAQRALPEEDRDLGFWGGRGYAGLGAIDGGADALDVARLRLDATAHLGAVRLRASAEGHGARGDVFLGLPDAPGARTGAEGTAAAGRAEAAWARRGLSLRASVRAQGSLSGDDGYRAAWRRLPRLGAVAEATARPDDRLALWARLEARGSTRWDGFPEADLPAVLLLDLGLSKRAWGDRLRASLGGRNVLGATERTHPLGAALAPRLLVRVEARL